MADKSIWASYRMPPVIGMPEGNYVSNEQLPDPNLLFGIELEIENFRPRDASIGFHFEPDGSLRNNGNEAISMPTAAKYYEDMLSRFFRQHAITPANYSERCSTHIHMNVQDIDFNQLKVLCMLYQVFERLLFQWVGNSREENIFCVPWYQSGLTPQFIDRLTKGSDSAIRSWVKYSALNLLPIRTQGTIEFRHLHGTCDVPTIMYWIKLLSRMMVYAKKVTYKQLTETILEMNTVSNYDMFMTDVFQAEAPLLMAEDYKAKLSVGVVDTKLMLLKPKKPDAKSLYDGGIPPEDLAGLLAAARAPRVRRAIIQEDAPQVAVQDDPLPARIPGETAGNYARRIDAIQRERRMNRWLNEGVAQAQANIVNNEAAGIAPMRNWVIQGNNNGGQF